MSSPTNAPVDYDMDTKTEELPPPLLVQMKTHYLKRWRWYALAVVAFSLFAWKYTFSINITDSLPHHVYLVSKGSEIKRGDYAAFRYQGDYVYPKDMVFVKQALGREGDRIIREGRQFYLLVPLGEAVDQDKLGEKLPMNMANEIGPGETYFFAPNPRSLDSRYEHVGLVKDRQLIGKAIPLF